MKSQREIFSSNLKRILQEKNLSQNEFARRIGVQSGTISKWMTHSTYPRDEKIQKMADVLGVRMSDLTADPEDKRNSNTNFKEITSIYSKLNQPNQQDVVNYAQSKLDEQKHPRVPAKFVPMVGYSAAGTEAEPYCADTTGEGIKTNKVKADAFVMLTGDSMEPRFKKGEMVFYKSQPNIENGEFAIVEIDGDGAICKQVKIDYDHRKIILHSLNPKYKDIIMDPTRIRILGKVIE